MKRKYSFTSHKKVERVLRDHLNKPWVGLNGAFWAIYGVKTVTDSAQ